MLSSFQCRIEQEFQILIDKKHILKRSDYEK